MVLINFVGESANDFLLATVMHYARHTYNIKNIKYYEKINIIDGFSLDNPGFCIVSTLPA